MLNSAGMEDTARERERRKKETGEREGREGATVGDLAVGALRPALWRPLTLVPKVPDVSRSSLPFLPLLLSPRSLSDRHTFSKIDLGSAATVTRAAPLSERERERPATSNRRCRTDSVLNSCLGLPLACLRRRKREERSFSLSSRVFAPFPLSCASSNDVSLLVSRVIYLFASTFCVGRVSFYLPLFGPLLHRL